MQYITNLDKEKLYGKIKIKKSYNISRLFEVDNSAIYTPEKVKRDAGFGTPAK